MRTVQFGISVSRFRERRAAAAADEWRERRARERELEEGFLRNVKKRGAPNRIFESCGCSCDDEEKANNTDIASVPALLGDDFLAWKIISFFESFALCEFVRVYSSFVKEYIKARPININVDHNINIHMRRLKRAHLHHSRRLICLIYMADKKLQR